MLTRAGLCSLALNCKVNISLFVSRTIMYMLLIPITGIKTPAIMWLLISERSIVRKISTKTMPKEAPKQRMAKYKDAPDIRIKKGTSMTDKIKLPATAINKEIQIKILSRKRIVELFFSSAELSTAKVLSTSLSDQPFFNNLSRNDSIMK